MRRNGLSFRTKRVSKGLRATLCPENVFIDHPFVANLSQSATQSA